MKNRNRKTDIINSNAKSDPTCAQALHSPESCQENSETKKAKRKISELENKNADMGALIDGQLKNSKVRMYLMLCAANTSLAETSLDIKSWTSEHFEVYAQYLDKRPLANYALCYLKHHIDGGQQDENVQSVISQFIDKLVDNPAVYLLESWLETGFLQQLKCC
ncbi:hypothetical protein K469DRAFT_756353 [Zopfia rhizophila CBS 207.26]|uniref:Uncharacterized protein n=1 Tax=Zopfia rhizophila CBS 207.26 TaxID=1314779 RepID=A0A6A6D6U2_9PEZI|nr:hypothetical protein K469DRAFT_756353 [Zopfia rhizophila CBS 207.26]